VRITPFMFMGELGRRGRRGDEGEGERKLITID
jgi:hypothetical protein